MQCLRSDAIGRLADSRFKLQAPSNFDMWRSADWPMQNYKLSLVETVHAEAVEIEVDEAAVEDGKPQA